MQISARGILSKAEPGTDHAAMTFPTITCLANGDMLACWRQGAAKECADERIGFARSTDNGRSWGVPAFPFDDLTIGGHAGSLNICYLTPMPNDEPGGRRHVGRSRRFS
ncbi:sialidase family protein [Devosia algicola]|uniref:Sialidase family protein n=1 Tax=Devosia algicola TaxID=3026418 RepID=A0ABY7YMZ4_9HYPH|nr:sialidase family protein [Devosia algicola]WDR02599.1 sialidase family protein [Devosia algicola]